MSYITETYYSDTYYGFTVPSLKFSYYSERATEKVNEYIEEIEEIDESENVNEIKKCTCAVMDQIYNIDNNQELSSETNSNYKRTYKDSTPAKSNNAKIYDIVLKYLGKTGLLYRGATYVYQR